MNKNLTSLAKRAIYFTIKDARAASRLTDLLISSPDDSIILPFTDHPGPMSSEILSRRFRSLTVCEPNDATRHAFQAHVEQRHSEKNIRIYPDDLFDLCFKTHIDHAQRKCSDIVKEISDLEEKSQEVVKPQKSHVKLLVPLLRSRQEATFLRNMYYQMCLKIGLCSNVLIHYYFLMSDRQYNYLGALPSENFRTYRATTILYNTIFNVHNLGFFDLEDCFKISLKKIQKSSEKNNSSYQKVHLVWLEPRLEIINSISPKSLMEYRFFVNQIMHKRTALVIPLVERWFTGLSSYITELGISKSTRSGDLTKDQLYHLFRFLKSSKNYNKSAFVQAAAHAEENISSFKD